MNMIDKDAVLNMIDSNIEPHTHGAWDSGYNVALGEMKEKIKQMPTVETEPDKGWISVEDRLPHTERDVLIAVDSGIGGYIIAIGFYEDGKRFAGDSACNWDNDYIDMMYNEDADDWIIPQGWYEGVMFGEEFTEITDKVVYWQPLPKPPKGK